MPHLPFFRYPIIRYLALALALALGSPEYLDAAALMLSYIVALVAAFIFLANPISQIFFPMDPSLQQRRSSPSSSFSSPGRVSPQPRLNESMLAIDAANATVPDCPIDTYVARVLSREPLVVYLEGFLSEEERRHLLDVSGPLFEPSTVSHDARTPARDTTVRDSSVALVPRTDAVRCVERRARAVQGWRRDTWIERLRTQRYEAPSGHYAHHFDWSGNVGGWGRVSSFMFWVDDGVAGELEGGGTEFPLLEAKVGDEGRDWWCTVAKCDEETVAESEGEGDGEGDERKGKVERAEEEGDGGGGTKGTTFTVVPGNAVYWENFALNGREYQETWHAGLPVKNGTKVGLNIWSFGRIE